MITENAFVDAVDGDTAWVSAQRRSACGSCNAREGCGTSVLGKVVGAKVASLQVHNPLQARPGDEVQVAIEENALVKGAVMLYMVPLLAFFVMGALGNVLVSSHQDLAAIVMGLSGLAAGLLWVGRYERKRFHEKGFYAEIVAIVGATATVPPTTVPFKNLSSGE